MADGETGTGGESDWTREETLRLGRLKGDPTVYPSFLAHSI